MTKSNSQTASKSQSDKFKDLARELETNEDEAAFDRVLRKITKKPHTLGEPKALTPRPSKAKG